MVKGEISCSLHFPWRHLSVKNVSLVDYRALKPHCNVGGTHSASFCKHFRLTCRKYLVGRSFCNCCSHPCHFCFCIVSLSWHLTSPETSHLLSSTGWGTCGFIAEGHLSFNTSAGMLSLLVAFSFERLLIASESYCLVDSSSSSTISGCLCTRVLWNTIVSLHFIPEDKQFILNDLNTCIESGHHFWPTCLGNHSVDKIKWKWAVPTITCAQQIFFIRWQIAIK